MAPYVVLYLCESVENLFRQDSFIRQKLFMHQSTCSSVGTMTTAIKAIVQPKMKIFVHLLTLMLSQNYMTFYF